MTACQNGHEEIVRLLLEAGASTRPRNPLNKSASEIARESGRTAIVSLLENYNRENEHRLSQKLNISM